MSHIDVHEAPENSVAPEAGTDYVVAASVCEGIGGNALQAAQADHARVGAALGTSSLTGVGLEFADDTRTEVAPGLDATVLPLVAETPPDAATSGDGPEEEEVPAADQPVVTPPPEAEAPALAPGDAGGNGTNNPGDGVRDGDEEGDEEDGDEPTRRGRRAVRRLGVPGEQASDSTVQIFNRTERPDAEYVDRVYGVNLPAFRLVAPTDRYAGVATFEDPDIRVTPDAHERILERMRHLAAIPHDTSMPIGPEDMAIYEKWIEGMVYERTEEEIAEYTGLGNRRTLVRVVGDMRRYLGTSNQASTVYSMLLHGHRQGSIHQYEVPPMDPVLRFQLLLTGGGFTESEAARLTTTNPDSPVHVSQIKRQRRQAYEHLRAETAGYALVNAFRFGMFRPIAPPAE